MWWFDIAQSFLPLPFSGYWPRMAFILCCYCLFWLNASLEYHCGAKFTKYHCFKLVILSRERIIASLNVCLWFTMFICGHYTPANRCQVVMIVSLGRTLYPSFTVDSVRRSVNESDAAAAATMRNEFNDLFMFHWLAYDAVSLWAAGVSVVDHAIWLGHGYLGRRVWHPSPTFVSGLVKKISFIQFDQTPKGLERWPL